MMIVRLALQSLFNRWVTALLTVLAIAVSVMLLLGVEKVRTGARQSFADTISGTDLIVGARSGSLNLLLYSVFRIGNATNNVTWKSYQDIAKRPEVAWIVPLSLGDSHHGFRVLGTNADYFTHYKFRHGQSMEFAAGGPFKDLFDAVIGADVAEALGYKVGDKIIVAHGVGSISFIKHEDKPFRVSGILEKTGTPVDRTVHVSLEAIEAIHIDWQNGAPIPGQSISADEVRKMDLTPKAITAAMVGLKSKLATFKIQRAINNYQEEPLSAIMPGVALQELWGLIGTAETALSAVSAMVVVTALARHGDDDPHDAERAPSRDGHSAICRRDARNGARASCCRGRTADARRRHRRNGLPLRRTLSRAAIHRSHLRLEPRDRSAARR